MEKHVKIDNKEYKLIYKGATARLYRDTFSEDCLTKLQEMQWAIDLSMSEIKKEASDADEYTQALMLTKAIDNAFIERLLWASIKVGKKNKKVPSYEEFVDNVENYGELINIGTSWLVEILKSMQPTVEVEEDEEENKDEEDKKKLN